MTRSTGSRAAIFASPTDEQLQQLFSLKRELVAMRKVVTPQRDLFARAMDQIAEVPGLELDERDYFRDVYDHLIRISDLIDSYRDLLSGATDLYLSTVSNRQNDVMKQLTVIATIFLPLTLYHRLLRPELRIHGQAHHRDMDILGARGGQHVRDLHRTVMFFRRKGWI